MEKKGFVVLQKALLQSAETHSVFLLVNVSNGIAVCNPDIALVPPVQPWLRNSCLWLSHEMPGQGALCDSLHHIDNSVHHQFKILQFSVQSWLLVLADRNFLWGPGSPWAWQGWAAQPHVLLWCISPKMSLMSHQAQVWVPHQWSRLYSCPLAGLGSIFRCFFLPKYLLSKSSSWHIKAHPGQGCGNLVPVRSQLWALESQGWAAFGLQSRKVLVRWTELCRAQWKWQGCHCPLMEGRWRQFHWAARPELPGSSSLCMGTDKMIKCLCCVYVYIYIFLYTYIFDTCAAPSLVKGSSAPVLGFMGMLVSICPLGCAATGCSAALWSFLLSLSALHVLRKGCVVQIKSLASFALYLTWNDDLVPANSRRLSAKWKSCFFPPLHFNICLSLHLLPSKAVL